MKYYKDEKLTKKIRKMSEKGLKKSSVYLYFKGRYDEKHHLIQEVSEGWQSPFIEAMRKTYRSNQAAVYNETDRILFLSRQERGRLKHQVDAIDFQILRLKEDNQNSGDNFYTNEEIRKKVAIEAKISALKDEKTTLEEEIKQLENDINRIESEATQLLNRSNNILENNIARYLQAAKKILNEDFKVEEIPDDTAHNIYVRFVEQYH